MHNIKPFWDFPLFREEYFDNSLSGLTVSEDSEHIYIEAQVPGVPIEDIHVEFEDGYLNIHAEIKEEEKQKKYYKKSQNVFSYSLNVPGKIDAESDIQATCKNGILKITFRKLESKPSGKKIHVKEE